MKTLTVKEVARDLEAVVTCLNLDQEEVELIHNGKRVAMLVPEPLQLAAPEFFADMELGK